MLQLKIAGVDYTPSLLAKTLKIKREVIEYDASFSLLSSYGENIHCGQEVQILDGDVLIYGGILNDIAYSDYSDDEQKVIIEIDCKPYSRFATNRTVNVMLMDITNAGTVIRQYLNYVLAQEGITEGKIEDMATIYDLESLDMFAKNLYTIFDTICGIDNSSWFIDIDKKLYAGKTLKTPIVHDIVIKRNSSIDIRELKVKKSLDNYRNKQFFIGGEPDTEEALPGDPNWVEHPGYDIRIMDDGRLEVVKQLDTEIAKMQTLFPNTTGVYGNVKEDSKVVTIKDAKQAVDTELEKYGHDNFEIEFDTFYSGFVPGNFLNVEYPEFNIQTGTTFVIDSIEISDIGNKVLNYHISASQRTLNSANTRKVDLVDYLLKDSKISNSAVVFY